MLPTSIKIEFLVSVSEDYEPFGDLDLLEIFQSSVNK